VLAVIALCCGGLQVNTFKDGLLKGNDHAGAGLMLTRMAEVRQTDRQTDRHAQAGRGSSSGRK